MSDPTIKDDLIEILMTIYKIPGQYLIAGLFSYGIYEIIKKNSTNGQGIFLVLSIIFFSLEIISPIFAGKRLYDKFCEKE